MPDASTRSAIWPAVFCFLFLLSCVARPVNGPRDATIVPEGEKRFELMGNAPVYLGPEATPTIWGGSLDTAIRYGTGISNEVAARIGLTPYGLYGGLEGARLLTEHTAFNLAGYAGLLGGLDALSLAASPAHAYLQGYGGLVHGDTQGFWRYETHVRGGLQAGLLNDRPYADLSVTLEPRLRLAGARLHVTFGLGFDGGFSACSRCTLEPDRTRTSHFYWGVHPVMGVSLP